MPDELEVTETQEEAGSSQEQAVVEPTEEIEKQVETPETPEEKKTEDENAKKQNVINERFRKITAQKYEQKTRADFLQSELDKIKKTQKPKYSQEPNYEQFDNDEEYVQAKVDYHVSKATHDLEIQNAESQRQSVQNKIEVRYVEQVRKANIDGFSEAVNVLTSSVLFSPEILTAIQSDEKAPELIMYLSEHLDVADEIASSAVAIGAVKLGKLTSKLTARKIKQSSKAPKPPEVLGGGGGSSKNLAAMSMDEIMKNPKI